MAALYTTWGLWSWVALFCGGVVCGVINTLAGGGSLITLPLLLFLGVPELAANASNRFALVIQNGAAVTSFWHQGTRDLNTIQWLAGPALVGSIIGAIIALHISPQQFRLALGILMLCSLPPIILRRQPFSQAHTHLASRPRPLLLVVFFFIGLYSGFIQAGVGVWSLLGLLFVGKFPINQANTIKSQLLFLTTLLATLLFLWHGQVLLLVGVALAAGNTLGAWLAAWLAHHTDLSWLRWLLLVVILCASTRLLGLW